MNTEDFRSQHERQSLLEDRFNWVSDTSHTKVSNFNKLIDNLNGIRGRLIPE